MSDSSYQMERIMAYISAINSERRGTRYNRDDYADVIRLRVLDDTINDFINLSVEHSRLSDEINALDKARSDVWERKQALRSKIINEFCNNMDVDESMKILTKLGEDGLVIDDEYEE